MFNRRMTFLPLLLIALACARTDVLPACNAGELTVEDFRLDGEYGSKGATLERVGRNHFRMRLKRVPENPGWTNMVQFIIEKNAAGNSLRIDIEGRDNENGIRSFVSWSHDRENWSPVKREIREENGARFATLSFPEFKENVVYVGGEVPLSYEHCVRLLKKYEQHPHATLHTIGKSLARREIYRLTITDPDSPCRRINAGDTTSSICTATNTIHSGE